MEPDLIRRLRHSRNLTQQQFATLLGVSFVTLNRWENGQAKPSALGLAKLQALVGQDSVAAIGQPLGNASPLAGDQAQRLDFRADANALRVLVEGVRLSYGHLFNPAFATEISEIDPLPHQRIAVYERMLPQPRLRFLLADDAGAGKTIMTGLYVRESLSRRTIRRVLVVAPAGLMGNWQRELRKLFQLQFRIVIGSDAKSGTPFAGAGSDLVIVSVDSLRTPRLFDALRDPRVAPYDLVVFDEAHKLSAHRDLDGTVRATDRYRLAEAIAGVRDVPDEWLMPWAAQHLLLLTATPHMGKAYPYYCLWRLLEPELFSTEAAFANFPPESRGQYFIRRVKEEMVDLRGKPLYAQRLCDTVSYDLLQGEFSEQSLYDRTTAYIRHYYNQARLLNRQAARFAMNVFQRRLASSTWALLCSLRKRLDKLDGLIDSIRSGRVADSELRAGQERLERSMREGRLVDALATKSADEEASDAGAEEHDKHEAEAMGAFVGTNLAELLDERDRVQELVSLAVAVHGSGHGSKFDRMAELLRAPQYREQKVIIYTEHRDTLEFLTQRLQGLGYAGQIACVHGGLGFEDRDAEVERFRRPHDADNPGARFFIGTDAAAEGINLQFCSILINYDVPWNPARLEQRMGRIHRYGQKRDRVAIINLVAGATREGRVVKTLLDKLEEIRKALGSDKVFDVVGRIFEGLPIAEYIQRAVDSDDEADRKALELAGRLTPQQVEAIEARERSVYGQGGAVLADLPRMHEAMRIEQMRRLLPGYVRRYLERAAPVIGVEFVGDMDGRFLMRPRKPGVLEGLLPLLEAYPGSARHRFTVHRPDDERDAIFLHPGEPIFDHLSATAIEQACAAGRQGAIFTDAEAAAPYLFHVARLAVLRSADPGLPSLHAADMLEQQLVGLQQHADGRLTEVPVERLLLLKPSLQASPVSVAFLSHPEVWRLAAEEHLQREVASRFADLRRMDATERLTRTVEHLQRAFDYQEAELAAARKRCAQRARDGHAAAHGQLEHVKRQQKSLAERRERALLLARREVELIQAGPVEILATALVQPSQDPDDIRERDAQVERIAMEVAIAFEQAQGAQVHDVSTPDRARLAGLSDHPGFDLLSRRSEQERGIEVKGRIGTGEIELTDNEWARACNLRERYWLYAVFQCGEPKPRLLRVQDPFGKLVLKKHDSYRISYGAIAASAETAA